MPAAAATMSHNTLRSTLVWSHSSHVVYLHRAMGVSAIITLAHGIAYWRKLLHSSLRLNTTERFPASRASIGYHILLCYVVKHAFSFLTSACAQ